jgi:hypothetical protein
VNACVCMCVYSPGTFDAVSGILGAMGATFTPGEFQTLINQTQIRMYRSSCDIMTLHTHALSLSLIHSHHY